jgi:hypothetical protein
MIYPPPRLVTALIQNSIWVSSEEVAADIEGDMLRKM